MFGVHQVQEDIIINEWIVDVNRVFLVGEFNNWDGEIHELKEKRKDIWNLKIENCNLSNLSGTKMKLKIETKNREIIYRVSPWARFLVFNVDNKVLESIFVAEKEFVFKHPRPVAEAGLKIYEAHIGIASCEPHVSTYRYFTANVLPRIKDLGYDTVQLMAVIEHAYYASFGYQVTNFFAPSSRFGSIEDLKNLIDEAHGMGLRVLLDVVHSHASMNSKDGLNMFNGTDGMFFHKGARGIHRLWGSRLFDYSKLEVLQFLISNLRMWVEDFQFDGFRFDGVTSMLYHHHGLGFNFSGQYHEYFDLSVDRDAVLYLMLANHFLREHFPFVTTICEDVSGMPTLCVPLSEGGFGFDYRLGMGIPDMWIRIVQSGEEWDVKRIVSTLCNRRKNEKTVCYCESHDQSLVGDKTLAFWLMDREMYTGMSVFSAPNATIEAGIALHKMIRLITQALGGEAYLSFIGNEFGHPEWLDFPRSGNNESYAYARRQWNLVDDSSLKYQFLNVFDQKMNGTERRYRWLLGNMAHVIHQCNEEGVIEFTRRASLFIFNFHPKKSYEGYRVGVANPGKYRCVLNTDDIIFGGFGRIDENVCYFSNPGECHLEQQHIKVYLPSRSAMVCVRVD